MLEKTALGGLLMTIGLFAATVGISQEPADDAHAASEHPEVLRFSTESLPYMGPADAPVVMVEFSDYACPRCGLHALKTEPLIVEKYVNPGNVRYVVVDAPPGDPSADAFKAAEAALCAGDQGKYWEMREILFENQRRFTARDLRNYGVRIGLNMPEYKKCLESGKHVERLRANIHAADQNDVRRIPTFYLGKVDPQEPDMLTVSETITGVKRFSVFQDAIKRLLSRTITDAAAGGHPR